MPNSIAFQQIFIHKDLINDSIFDKHELHFIEIWDESTTDFVYFQYVLHKKQGILDSILYNHDSEEYITNVINDTDMFENVDIYNNKDPETKHIAAYFSLMLEVINAKLKSQDKSKYIIIEHNMIHEYSDN